MRNQQRKTTPRAGAAVTPARLFTVTFTIPLSEQAALDEFTAAYGLQAAGWQMAEQPYCEVRIFCDTRTVARRVSSLVRRELRSWFVDAGVGTVTPRISGLAREDWAETWKRFFHTFRVSPRLVVKPAWETYSPRMEEVVVEIDPGMSFGTGYHGTTRACLEFIDGLSQEQPGVSLLDVGTGSGILAMAASRLGFQPVWACDHDPVAVGIAQENLVKAGCASVQVQEADLATYVPPGRARVVVANILAPVLIQFAPRLAGFVDAGGGQGGRLILSGILDSQFTEVVAAYAVYDCNLLEQRTLDGWTSGLFALAVPGSRKPRKA